MRLGATILFVLICGAPVEALDQNLWNFKYCVEQTTLSECVLDATDHWLSWDVGTITVRRSNVVLRGASLTLTRLMRAAGFTAPLIQVWNPGGSVLTGVVIRDMTVYGNRYYVNCPDCVDVAIRENVQGTVSPQGYFTYGVTIDNVIFIISAGHGLSVFRANWQPLNAVRVANSSFQWPRTTGIHGGGTRPSDYNRCAEGYLPDNLVIENNTFWYSDVGAIGLHTDNVTIRYNWLLHNQLNPPTAGGQIFIDQCSNGVYIHNNTLDAANTPILSGRLASGLELWGRNTYAYYNTIKNHPAEGIQANSVEVLWAFNNTIQDNSRWNQDLSQDLPGVLVWNRGSGFRTTRDVYVQSNVINHTSQAMVDERRQEYGVKLTLFLSDPFTPRSMSNVQVTYNDFGPPGGTGWPNWYSAFCQRPELTLTGSSFVPASICNPGDVQ